MNVHGAAPGAVSGELRGGLTTAGNTASIADLGLAVSIVERLAIEGVHTINDWARLGRKRFHIFGITTSTAKKIDALAREERT